MKKPNIIYQQNKKSGVVYAYEDQPYWDPEKKQSRSHRKMIGKIDPETGKLVPTRVRKAKESPIKTEDTPKQANEPQINLIDPMPIIREVLIFLRFFVCETLAKRIVGMVLIAVGVADNRVAELVGLCEKSVKTLKKGLERGEFDSIFNVGGGGRKRKLIDVEGLIVEEIKNNNYHSHQQIADMVYEKYGFKVSLPVIGRLLKKTELRG